MPLEFPAPRGKVIFPLRSRCPQPIHSPRNLNHLNHLIFPTLVLKRDRKGRLRRETEPLGCREPVGSYPSMVFLTSQELVSVLISDCCTQRAALCPGVCRRLTSPKPSLQVHPARSLRGGEFFRFVVLPPVLPQRKPVQWLLLHRRDPALLLHLGMTLSVGLVE